MITFTTRTLPVVGVKEDVVNVVVDDAVTLTSNDRTKTGSAISHAQR